MEERELDLQPSTEEGENRQMPRLGFAEIVPGVQTEETHQLEPDIPHYDLNQHSMSEMRQQVAARRRGPGQRCAAPPGDTEARDIQYPERARGLAPLLDIEPDPLITQLVARDIQRLSRGEPVFS